MNQQSIYVLVIKKINMFLESKCDQLAITTESPTTRKIKVCRKLFEMLLNVQATSRDFAVMGKVGKLLCV